MIKIPIKVGDTVLGGKFKNRKVVVKKIGKNENGDITINGKPLLRFRIIDNKNIEEQGMDANIKINKEELDQLINETADRLIIEDMYGTITPGENTVMPLNFHSIHSVKDEHGETIRMPIVTVEDIKRVEKVLSEILVQIEKLYVAEERAHKMAVHTYHRNHHKNEFDRYVASLEHLMHDALKFKTDLELLASKNIDAHREYMQTSARVARTAHHR